MATKFNKLQSFFSLRKSSVWSGAVGVVISGEGATQSTPFNRVGHVVSLSGCCRPWSPVSRLPTRAPKLPATTRGLPTSRRLPTTAAERLPFHRRRRHASSAGRGLPRWPATNVVLLHREPPCENEDISRVYPVVQ